MLTKCLRELEQDKFIVRKQYNTIPPTVEYSLAERGKTLIPALESVYQWAEEQMCAEKHTVGEKYPGREDQIMKEK